VLEVRHAGIVRGAWSAVVINLDNLQGGAVVNLGGLAADGRSQTARHELVLRQSQTQSQTQSR
jgi:hypothetical protein